MHKQYDEAMDFVAGRLAELFWEQWKETMKREKKSGTVITPPDEL